MSLDYEKDIEIDQDALDVECLEQGPLAMRYAKHVKFMKKKAAIAKEKVKTIRSELILQCNDDPVRTIGKAKPNAADIEAYYRTRKEYKEAKQEAIEAETEADFAEIARSEISFTRKKMLETLVTLHGQMYFAGPSVPRDLTKEWQQRQKEKKTIGKMAEKASQMKRSK